MPDIEPKDTHAPAAKTETKEFPKSAKIAVRELNKNLAASMQEIADAAAEELGLKPNDGWKLDLRSMSFTREVK